LERRDLAVRAHRSDDDVDVVANRMEHRNLGGRRFGHLAINELGWSCLTYRLSSRRIGDREIGEDHTLRLVDLHARTHVLQLVVIDVERLARTERDLLVDAPRAPGEADEQKDDAEMDDVAAVAMARLRHQV